MRKIFSKIRMCLKKGTENPFFLSECDLFIMVKECRLWKLNDNGVGVGLKESLKSVLTPARQGTMCERKTSEYSGRRKHFSETMALFVTFHGKNTAATAVTVCLGTTACRIATGVGWLECLQASLLLIFAFLFKIHFFLFQNNPYGCSVFWRVGSVIVDRCVKYLLQCLYVCGNFVKMKPQRIQCGHHSCIGIRAFQILQRSTLLLGLSY